jgi:hypothetical protein
MAVINDPNTAGNIAAVGNKAYSPLHTLGGPFPVGAGGAYRASAFSGTMAAALGANSELFQFRYVTAANRVCLVHGVAISASQLVAASAAGLAGFCLIVARSWTVAGSGGTRLTLTGNNQKMRTNQATSEVNDAGISTTTGLTAGTKTFDAAFLGSVSFSFLTGAITTIPAQQLVPKTNLLGDFVGALQYPLTLANQEGIVVRSNPNAFPAGATWQFSVDIAWSEVDQF